MSDHAYLFNVSPSGTTINTGNLVSNTGVSALLVTPGTGGTIVSDSSQSLEGGLSALLTPGGTQTQVLRLPFPSATRQGAVCLHHRRGTLGAFDLLSVRHASGQLFRIGISGTGSVQAKDGSGNTLGSTSPGSAWAIDRWNRIEFKFSNSGGTTAGTIDIAVYNADSTTATGTLSLAGVNLGDADAVSMDIGTPTSTSLTIPHWLDAIQMGSERTTFFGPYVDLPPAPVLNTLEAVTIGPGEQKEITATLASGTATSWSWRHISGPNVTMSGSGATRTLTGPSIMPPGSSVAVFGVKAINDPVESIEQTVSVTILPQLSWTRVHGGDWVGSRVVPA
jgi:hypothetical protein